MYKLKNLPPKFAAYLLKQLAAGLTTIMDNGVHWGFQRDQTRATMHQLFWELETTLYGKVNNRPPDFKSLREFLGDTKQFLTFQYGFEVAFDPATAPEEGGLVTIDRRWCYAN